MESNRSIGLEIKIISNLLKRKMFEKLLFSREEELTDMQGQIIDFLYENRNKGEIFQRDVELQFSIRRSSASRLLQVLERKGILTRETVQYDARLKKLVLTTKANEKHEQLKLKIEEMETLIKRGLTNEELEVFFTITEKIKKNIR